MPQVISAEFYWSIKIYLATLSKINKVILTFRRIPSMLYLSSFNLLLHLRFVANSSCSRKYICHFIFFVFFIIIILVAIVSLQLYINNIDRLSNCQHLIDRSILCLAKDLLFNPLSLASLRVTESVTRQYL